MTPSTSKGFASHPRGVARLATSTNLPPHDLAVFDEIAGDALDLLGYPRSGLRRSPTAVLEATRVELQMRARRIRRVSSRRIGRRMRAWVPHRTVATKTKVYAPAPATNLTPIVDPPDLDLFGGDPAHNAAAKIDEQLAALTAEAARFDWEIIVADNGSRDATTMIVERWAQRCPRIRLVDASDAPARPMLGTPGPAPRSQPRVLRLRRHRRDGLARRDERGARRP